MEDRQLADGPARPALRAGDAVRLARRNFALKNNWAPRLGVVWDPTGSGVAKVFANYGRYYARVPNDLAARALSSDASLTADYFDANLTHPVPDGTVTTNA